MALIIPGETREGKFPDECKELSLMDEWGRKGETYTGKLPTGGYKCKSQPSVFWLSSPVWYEYRQFLNRLRLRIAPKITPLDKEYY